ncbi:hypothetical protein JB92DRAFT_1783899 [Gautieria morchelliformis]|nr:hypothetical protein JB92DRAFT_1783899 [Gautieria morchelliformis]
MFLTSMSLGAFSQYLLGGNVYFRITRLALRGLRRSANFMYVAAMCRGVWGNSSCAYRVRTCRSLCFFFLLATALGLCPTPLCFAARVLVTRVHDELPPDGCVLSLYTVCTTDVSTVFLVPWTCPRLSKATRRIGQMNTLW